MLGRCGIGIVAGSLFLVAMVTLFPFNFHFSHVPSLPVTIAELFNWNVVDWLSNVALFMPLGFGLSCSMEKSRFSTTNQIAAVLVVGASVSALLEIVQLFLPTRFSGFNDVIANAIGALLGYSLFRLFRDGLFGSLLAVAKNGPAYLSLKALTVAFVGYFLIVCLVTSVLATAGSLDRWDENYTLLVGNEHTGDRPWNGTITELVIANKAISPKEVDGVFRKTFAWSTLGDALIGRYKFEEKGIQKERAYKLPDLGWRSQEAESTDLQSVRELHFSDDVRKPGALVSANHWLETKGPATFMVRSIRETSAFALSVTVAAADSWQNGPARIISLSESPYSRNFTLGQQQTDLVFRLRTRISGENGSAPEYRIANVFADTDLHQIVVVYDGRHVRLYVDNVNKSYHFDTIGVAVMDPIAAIQGFLSTRLEIPFALDIESVNAGAYMALYFVLIFLPMGVMIGVGMLIARVQPGNLSIYVGGAIMLPVIALPAILGSGGTGGVQVEDTVIGLGTILASLLLFRMLATACSLRKRGVHLSAVTPTGCDSPSADLSGSHVLLEERGRWFLQHVYILCLQHSDGHPF